MFPSGFIFSYFVLFYLILSYLVSLHLILSFPSYFTLSCSTLSYVIPSQFILPSISCIYLFLIKSASSSGCITASVPPAVTQLHRTELFCHLTSQFISSHLIVSFFLILLMRFLVLDKVCLVLWFSNSQFSSRSPKVIHDWFVFVILHLILSHLILYCQFFSYLAHALTFSWKSLLALMVLQQPVFLLQSHSYTGLTCFVILHLSLSHLISSYIVIFSYRAYALTCSWKSLQAPLVLFFKPGFLPQSHSYTGLSSFVILHLSLSHLILHCHFLLSCLWAYLFLKKFACTCDFATASFPPAIPQLCRTELFCDLTSQLISSHPLLSSCLILLIRLLVVEKVCLLLWFYNSQSPLLPAVQQLYRSNFFVILHLTSPHLILSFFHILCAYLFLKKSACSYGFTTARVPPAVPQLYRTDLFLSSYISVHLISSYIVIFFLSCLCEYLFLIKSACPSGFVTARFPPAALQLGRTDLFLSSYMSNHLISSYIVIHSYLKCLLVLEKVCLFLWFHSSQGSSSSLTAVQSWCEVFLVYRSPVT